MDTVLVVITLISAVTAIVAVVSAGRVRRNERERSDARAAALAQAADTHGALEGGWTSVAGEWQWNPEPSQQPGIRDSGFGTSAPRASREERVIRVADPISHPQPAITAGSGSGSDRFFGTVQREDTPGSRLPVFAAAALIAMLGGALLFLNTSNTSTPSDRTPTVARVSHTEPLELVALAHARDVSSLTISGTVRNPRSGVNVEGLTAVISLLDRNGALISIKDVPLDYRALGPGEEAPFKVSVPDPGSIARYRVSFRAGTDVVPHVDRRTDTKLASALQ